jgi:hypothetical protein
MEGGSMIEDLNENEEMRKAYVLAWVLTGCEEGASRVVKESIQEVGAHPAGSDLHKRSRLLMAAVRRRSLKFPARYELPPGLEALHKGLEPGRSLVLYQDLEIFNPGESASTLDLEKAGATLEEKKMREALGSDSDHVRLLTELKPSPSKECLEALDRYHRNEIHRGVKNPATLAVGMAFLLLIAVLVWHFTGRAGTFPEEAIKIVELARRAKQENFSPVDVKLEHLPDWFAMQGFDGLRIPAGFEDLNAVGVRTFQHEGETVAQMAILDGERNVYMLSFPASPFDIRGLRPEAWQITSTGRFASAITEKDGICTLITFSGSEEDMKSFLANRSATR